MNTEYYKATILIFIAIFIFNFTAKTQSSDTIRIVKRPLGTVYYQDSVILNLKQIMELTKENEKAYKIIKKANSLYNVVFCFSVAGGCCIGASIGGYLGGKLAGNNVEFKKFLPILGAGVGFIVCSVPFGIMSSKKIKKGINVFNNSKKQNTNIDLGFSANGLNLRLKF